MNRESTTQIVYDDDEIRVIWQNGSTDFLLMTFGDLITPANGHRYFADTPARKAGITALGIMSKRGNWYPKQNLHLAYRTIQPLIQGYATRIAYGGSMGGYAAIKFSRLLGATHVIALCAQWSIDMDECAGVNPSWQSYFDPGMRGMGIRPDDVAGHVFLFFDGFDALEMFHCRKIIEAYPSARHINVPMVSHHVTSVLAGTSNLLALLNACQALDFAALDRLSFETRRNHIVRRIALIEATLRRLPKLGYRMLLKFARRDVSHVGRHKSYIYALMADILNDDGPQAAARFYRECRAVLDPIEQIKACAHLTRLSGAYPYIETTHGTALIYNIKDNRCVHRSACTEIFEAYVQIEVFGQFAAFFVVIGAVKFYLTRVPQSTLCIPGMDGTLNQPFNFKIGPASAGKFALKWADFYLCAELVGDVFCNRSSAGGWEHFMIGVSDGPAGAAI